MITASAKPAHRYLIALTAGLAAAALTAGILTTGTATAATVSPSRVQRQLESMTLEEKVGQLFITYVYGETSDTTDPGDVAANQDFLGVDNGDELIDTYHPGGIIYFAWSNNLNAPDQIAGLSNGLQEAALAQPAGIPLLISTDQEHGVVTRFGPPATQFPGNMALGAVNDPMAAATAGQITGRELRAVGINQNFAPIADVNINPANPVIGVRSFSSDPQLAADLTAAQVTGYQVDDGVTATAKHFPGHGNTDQDSHLALPSIPHSYDEWAAIDAPPFEAAIEAGIDSIMTAHIQFPALDDSLDPATLSQPIMTGLLREQLGFDGLVVTDSLSMAGVRELYSDEEIPVRALEAGVDMLLMPPDLDLAYNAVLDAVATGRLTEQRIDESVARILAVKHARGIVDAPLVDPENIDTVVGIPDHLAAAQDISDRSITLVENDGVLPLATDDGAVLVTGADTGTVAGLAEHVDRRGLPVTSLPSGADPDDAAIDEIAAAAASHEVTIMVTANAAAHPGQVRLAQALVASGATVVAVSVNVPYDIALMTEVAGNVAAYSTTTPTVDATASVLFGEVNPSGALPVTIPVEGDPDTPLYELGHGLQYP